MTNKNEIPSEKSNHFQTENEKIKKLLVEEHGAYFPDLNEESDLPFEMENQFLNHVLAFENEYKTMKQISVYHFLGEPIFKPANELTDEELAVEFCRMTQLMNKHRLALNTICDVPERELYRFFTEELLFEEIDDMHIPGMVTNFTYEEFHPNHQYDIESHSIDFFEFYLNLKHDHYLHLLTSEAEKSDWHKHFRKAFNSFQLDAFSIIGINIDDQSAIVQFECDFSCRVDGCHEALRYVGVGEMTLLYQYEYWSIDTLKLPKSKVCNVHVLR